MFQLIFFLYFVLDEVWWWWKDYVSDEAVYDCTMEIMLREWCKGKTEVIRNDVLTYVPDGQTHPKIREGIMPKPSITCSSIDNKQIPMSLLALSFTILSLTCLCPPDSNDFHEHFPFCKLGIYWPVSPVQGVWEEQLGKGREVFNTSILMLTGTLVLV